MKQTFQSLKALLAGTWSGEGFATFPTINNTGYTESWHFEPDNHKDAIHYVQKTWYLNNTPNNGKTVFWDTGFILLKDDNILLVSAQSGGRLESYKLEQYENGQFVFNSKLVENDPKTTRSQRILNVTANTLEYELNMNAKEAPEFQNHLKASLKKMIRAM
jgi:hypothetical protein